MKKFKMNFNEKVDYIVEKIVYNDIKTSEGINNITEIIRISLKEQDRDTRHACAESILNCIGEKIGGTPIDKNEAHSSCMNTRGGIK